MINKTSIKIPKKYIPMISEVFQDSDGYWAYCKEGFEFSSMECGTAHEDTQSALLSVIRTLREVM